MRSLDTLDELEARYEYSHTTQGRIPITYRQFMALIHELLIAAWGQEWGERFGPEAPPAHALDNPYIKYRLLRRSPTKEIAGNSEPRRRGEMRDRKDPTNTFELWGQLFDHLIEFECVAPTPDQADELAERFEEFMLTYRPFFAQNGVHKILFVEQDEDRYETSAKEPSYGRPLVYYVRLDRVYPLPVSVLESIHSYVNLSSAP